MGRRKSIVGKVLAIGFLGGVAAASGLYVQRALHAPNDASPVRGSFILPQGSGSEEPVAFALRDMAGNLRSSSEWSDSLMVLNFWATWCAPCREEIPLFTELQAAYGDQGLQFVGVALDELETVRDYARTYGINYPILLGEQDAFKLSRRVGNRMGVLPFTAVVNREGRIVFSKAGKVTRSEAEDLIAAHL